MSAQQRWMATTVGLAVAGLSVFAAAMSIAAGLHKSTAPAPVESRVNVTLPHASTSIVTLMHWDVGKGPDPFALRRRAKVRLRSTPLRKRLHLDTPLLGRYRRQPVRPPRPSIDPGINIYPSKIRMAGYFSGNGVYAVLATPTQTIVVNPGDSLDDGGKVMEIRPRQTTLQRDDRTYDVDMREKSL